MGRQWIVGLSYETRCGMTWARVAGEIGRITRITKK